MQKLTYRKFLKQRTSMLMMELLSTLVSKEEAAKLTPASVEKQFPLVSYYTDQGTGQRKLGLCRKLVRKMVKRNPYVTVDELRKEFKLA